MTVAAMKLVKKFVRFIRKLYSNAYYGFGYRLIKYHPKWMTDKFYLKIQYFLYFERWPDIKNPTHYSEKLLWLKLYDRIPEHSVCVDKYEAKKWAADRIGGRYITRTYGVWNRFEEIDFSKLPGSFVLKCTHDSGSCVFCKDKNSIDKELVKSKLDKALARNFYYCTREWPYKSVRPRIIAEEYLQDNDSDVLLDYKWFCFDGEPRFMYISNDGGSDTTTDFYDMEFNRLPMKMRDPGSDRKMEKPAGFDEMRALASKLSWGMKHVRVDFYVIGSEVRFGEMTFFHNGGIVSICPEEWDLKVASWIRI